MKKLVMLVGIVTALMLIISATANADPPKKGNVGETSSNGKGNVGRTNGHEPPGLIKTDDTTVPLSEPFALTYYVATSGSDTYGDGTENWVDNDSSGDWSAGDTGPWLTISHAVSQVLAGDTIIVGPGTYTEAVTIDESLTLLGATSDDCKTDFTLPGTLGDYDDTVESIIKAPVTGEPNTVTITSSDVVLKGFVIEALDRVSGSGKNNNNLIELRPLGTEATMTGIVIENNVIGPNTDVATQSYGRHGLRITAGYGHTIGATVTGNKIHGTYGNGNNVFIWGTAYGTTGLPSAGGYGPADLSGTLIQNNDICKSARSGVECSGALFGLTIDNNTIHDNGTGHEGGDVDLKYGEGIAFVRDYCDVNYTGYTGLGANAGYVDGVTVTGNEIYNNDKNGIYIGPMNKNHVITGNNIHDNGNSARGSSSMFGPGDAIRVDLEGWYYSNSWFGGPYANALYGSTLNIVANYNNIVGNVGYGAQILGTPTNGFTLDATNNWWGHKSGAYQATTNPSGLGDEVTDYVNYDPWLKTNQINLACGGARLVEKQHTDGAWGWPLDAPPTYGNTIGPIGMGLAQAYRATSDSDMYAALVKVSTFLLAKTSFSGQDGYMAAELDSILGGTSNVDLLNTNFYGLLATGTYYRASAPVGPYDTQGYVTWVRNNRTGVYANLAAWDVGMALVAAASCGVSGSELDYWIDGVKAEIDELDGSGWYDVIGLAGAVYGLAFVGEDFDPTAGEHTAASDLSDLAAILAGYQIAESGGFAWNSEYVIAYDYNETIQETAYSALALNEIGGYRNEIVDAVNYMESVQLCTGGWENYVGSTSGENNEITAEAMWGLALANLLKLNVEDTSLYVKLSETVVIDMDVANLLQKVNACQAMLGYNSTYLTANSGSVVPGGGVWDELLWYTYDPGTGPDGEIDTAIGIELTTPPSTGTDDDGKVATITLDPVTEGVTRLVFRPDLDPDPNLIESTFLSDMNAQTVWPNKMDSQTIVIDGTLPIIDITSAKQGGEELLISLSSAINAVQGDVTITVSASDALAGLDGIPTVTVTDFASVATDITSTGVDNLDGTFTYTYTVTSTTANGTATIYAEVSDKSGNTNFNTDTFNINKNQITGQVELEDFVGTGTAPLHTRDVTFVATGGVSIKSWTLTLANISGAIFDYTLTDVPDGTNGLSAKTAWHLRTKLTGLELDEDGQLVDADFTVDDKLRGGDLNGTNGINILDYSILAGNWFTANAVADITGDGPVNSDDYQIMVLNWFSIGDDE